MDGEKPACVSALLRFLGLQDRTRAAKLPYRRRGTLLTAAEASFYRLLISTVGDGVRVFPKVRLADIFYITSDQDYIRNFNRISAKHLDFLICDANTLRPLLGIELDDGSHRRHSRRVRDEFVDQLFAAAGLPLLRVPVRKRYDAGRLQRQITEALGTSAQATPPRSPCCDSVSRLVAPPDRHQIHAFGSVLLYPQRGLVPLRGR